MNTARSTLARIGGGVFSAVLGTVLLVMLAALYVANQSLYETGRARAEAEAGDARIAIQQIVAARVEALGSMRGGLIDRIPAERARALSALARTLAAQSPAPRRLTVADSAGRVLNDSIGQRVSDTTWAGAALGEVRARGWLVNLTSSGAAQRGVVLTVPLEVDGQLAGVAVAEYAVSELFAPLTVRKDSARASLLVRAGADTVFAAPVPSELSLSDAVRQQVPFPGGAEWTLDVRHVVESANIRFALWGLGLVAVVFLGAGVIRERRQAIRVAERSGELERLSTELLRANRMKSEFLANVSHELRTPLNAIVGFVDLLREGVYGELSPRQVPPVDRIAASATHLRHLVDQVLDIAKIAAGRLEVHAEVIALRPFVLNVVSELESLISERDLNLSIAVGASLPRVRTDPTHLRQILVNLIGNAVKFTPAGSVAVRARLVNGMRRGAATGPGAEDPALVARAPEPGKVWVALQVIDTGIGIAPADQQRIFDEFEQVNAGPRGDSIERGTGLGLAISRRLARLLGGDLTVDSQLGKGSTFTVWLLAHAADMQPDERARSLRRSPVPTEAPAGED